MREQVTTERATIEIETCLVTDYGIIQCKRAHEPTRDCTHDCNVCSINNNNNKTETTRPHYCTHIESNSRSRPHIHNKRSTFARPQPDRYVSVCVFVCEHHHNGHGRTGEIQTASHVFGSQRDNPENMRFFT